MFESASTNQRVFKLMEVVDSSGSLSQRWQSNYFPGLLLHFTASSTFPDLLKVSTVEGTPAPLELVVRAAVSSFSVVPSSYPL